MHSRSALLPAAFVVLLLSGRAAAGIDHPRVETRFATVTLEADADDDHAFLLSTGSGAPRRYEGLGVSLVQYESGESYLSSRSRDFVLVEINSGGIACPYQYAIVDTAQARAPVVSESFGSCGEIAEAEVRGDDFIVTVGPYDPHPELLPPAERRLELKTRTIYTWSAGRLSERRRTAK